MNFCEIFKNAFFTEHLLTTAPDKQPREVFYKKAVLKNFTSFTAKVDVVEF